MSIRDRPERPGAGARRYDPARAEKRHGYAPVSYTHLYISHSTTDTAIFPPAGVYFTALSSRLKRASDVHLLSWETYLDNMKTSSEHLLKLVVDLLDFHRLDLNKAETNRVTFHPSRLLEETVCCSSDRI